MNKDIQTKEYMKKMEGMKLSESSRVRIENNLLAYARFHGVRVGEDSRSIEQVPQRTSFITHIFNLNKKSMTATIIIIALIAGGGTSYAAESAVPGDFLYAIKTEVNENVKSAFAVSNEDEAALQAHLAEERLEEAEELAVRGELTAEVATDISARLKTHYDEAEERNTVSEAKGDYESSASVRASLEGSFRTYADVLDDLNARVSSNNGTSLITDIQAYADAVAKEQTQATVTIEATADVQAIAEATINRADDFITEVKAKVDRAQSEITAEAHSRVEVKLAKAVSAQADAKASFQTETYHAAYTSAQTALRIASEVASMINSMLRLQVDVGLDVDTGIDVRTTSDTRTEVETDTRTETDSNTGTANDQSTDLPIDIEVDATTDIRVDTNVIDTDIDTESSVRSGLSL